MIDFITVISVYLVNLTGKDIMLIEKSIEDNDIVSVKLITNDEIIAKLVSQDAISITLQKPLTMNLSLDDRTGRPAIQMLPFFILGAKPDAKITLRRDHVLVLTLSNDEAKSGYIHNTSGLVTSTSGSGLVI